MDASLPHRLTIDVNIVRDFLESHRDGHKLAVELFARNGSDVELAIDLFPGQYINGFKEAWSQIIDTWKTDQGRAPAPPDDFHVEAHVVDKRDFFLTSDRALRAMCG